MTDISSFQPLGGLNGPVAAVLPSFGGCPHAGSGASVALQTGSGGIEYLKIREIDVSLLIRE